MIYFHSTQENKNDPHQMEVVFLYLLCVLNCSCSHLSFFFPGNQSCRSSSQFLLPAVGRGELGSACWGLPSVPALLPSHPTHLRRHPAGELFLRLNTSVSTMQISFFLSFVQTELKSFRCSFVATVIYQRVMQVRLARTGLIGHYADEHFKLWVL